MLDFDKMNGLVPAIIQDADTAKVLMLGFMNREAYDKTVETGKVTFFSRTKNRLWTKGEESGNFLNVVSMKEDCDKDTLLIQVHPVGPVCHTGTDTCWGEKNEQPVMFLKLLQDFIDKRHAEMPEGSYTTSLFRSGVNKMAQKVGEEAVETVIEACNGTDERLIYEGADLLYHLIVLLTSKGYRIEDFARELEERHSADWKKHLVVMDEVLIRYKDVEIHQQELCVLNDVNLELHKGEFVYLIGKVGSGKTSLLKTFYGELDVAAGDAEVLGYDMLHIKRKHIPQLRRKLGIVFQDFQLLTDRTVYDNLEFVLRATGWKNKGEIKDRINEVLQLVGMSNKGYKYPNELSGGEQQRIVIARAVLNSPEVILADEPTGNLDVETGFAITQLLHSISEAGSLVIMTTHNMQLLWEYPGRVYRCADHLITDVTEQYSVASSTEEK